MIRVNSDIHAAAQPTLVWGAGAIGGTLAAYLSRGGVPLRMVDQNAEHVEACRSRGLHIQGSVEEFTQVVDAATPAELTGQYDRVLLAVKAQHTAAAVQQIAPHLAPTGYIVSVQNGLNERLIAETVGTERTVGCFVNFGADWLGPGEIEFGGWGELIIGEIDGTSSTRVDELVKILRLFDPAAKPTSNIWGYLWGKLAFAALLFAASVTHDGMVRSFADLSRSAAHFHLAKEVYEVAVACGVQPMSVAGLDPEAFLNSSDEGVAASLKRISDRRVGSSKIHSGFYRDMAVRRRKTEVDELLVPVVQRGEEHNVPTPLVSHLVRIVHEIENGSREIGPENMAELDTLIDRGVR